MKIGQAGGEKMIFHVIHTHSNEDCPARSSENLKPVSSWWQGIKKATGVKVLSGYVSPLDHTFYITVEADDYQALSKALGPLVSIGTGEIIPVMTLDQVFPIAEAGTFRAAK
jgi:hypothetical protein